MWIQVVGAVGGGVVDTGGRGRQLRTLIDYFLVGKEAKKQLIDVKAVRGVR